MTNQKTRIAIAEETLTILGRGGYENADGAWVEFGAQQAFAVQNSRLHDSAQLEELRSSPSLATAQLGRFSTRFEVRNESTLAGATRLLGEGVEDPLCLNFASAKNPGGGFLRGTEAQEENLAKSSGLYPCLLPMMEMYESNRARKSSLYSDDMIYSPKVPVFRDDDYKLLKRSYLASMLTSPAVNRGAVAREQPELLGQVEAVMLVRIDKLLTLAAHYGHTTLLLGAWGCGVFANRPGEMADWFANQLLHNPRHKGVFERVSFAILDPRHDGTFAAFDAVFSSGMS